MVAGEVGFFADSHQNLLFSQTLHTSINVDAEVRNLFISAATIHCILALLQYGARGNTYTEIVRALHLRGDSESMKCVQANETGIVNIDAKLYVMTGFEIKDSYMRHLREQHVSVQAVNFANSEKATKIINDWIKRGTGNNIGELIPAGELDQLTRLVFVSVNHFNSSWYRPFNKRLTSRKPFYTGKNFAVDVNLMNQIQPLKYAEIDELDSQVLLLPYERNEAMLIILPKDRNGLNDVKRKLLAYGFQNLRSKLREAKETLVDLYLPKFNFTFIDDLRLPLVELGIFEMFQPALANLSGISDSPLYVNSVRQTSYIYVDEEGTKADSGTEFQVVDMQLDVVPASNVTFKVDHPFLFFILDSELKDLYFVGRYEIPFHCSELPRAYVNCCCS